MIITDKYFMENKFKRNEIKIKNECRGDGVNVIRINWDRFCSIELQ